MSVGALPGGITGPVDIQYTAEPPSFGPNQFRRIALAASLVCALFLVAFALGWIPGIYNRMGPVGLIVIYLAAAFLVGCGVWGWFLFGGVIRDRASRVSVSSSAVRVAFAGPPELAASWSDPSLRIIVTQVWQDPAKPLQFQLNIGGRRAYASILPAGLPKLEQAAKQNHLSFAREEKGKPPRNWTVWTLTHSSETHAALR